MPGHTTVIVVIVIYNVIFLNQQFIIQDLVIGYGNYIM